MILNQEEKFWETPFWGFLCGSDLRCIHSHSAVPHNLQSRWTLFHGFNERVRLVIRKHSLDDFYELVSVF